MRTWLILLTSVTLNLLCISFFLLRCVLRNFLVIAGVVLVGVIVIIICRLLILTVVTKQIIELAGLFGLGLALDVDLETGQTSCQTGVLSFFTDSQRKLIIRNDNLRCLLVVICDNGDDFGRAQCILNENCIVLVPVDDIDLLAAKLIDNRIDSGAVDTNAGSYGIYVRVVGINSHLGTGCLPHGRCI